MIAPGPDTNRCKVRGRWVVFAVAPDGSIEQWPPQEYGRAVARAKRLARRPEWYKVRVREVTTGHQVRVLG